MKLRRKSKHRLTALASALCCTLAAQSSVLAQGPNVIIWMDDDLGQDYTALYNPDDSELVQARRDAGNPFPENAPMPALEQLAKRGVAFENAWAMPVCSTTRGARSTGLYPAQTGVGQVIGQFTPRRGNPVGPPEFANKEFPPSILNPDDKHLLQRLAKKKGYRTYKFGKWHEVEVEFFEQDNVTPKVWDSYDLTDKVAAELATQGKDDALRAGFDEFYGLLSGIFGGINGNGYGGGDIPYDQQLTGAKLDDTTTDAIHMIDSRSTRVTDGVPDARNPTCEHADSALVTRAIQLIKEAKDAHKPYFAEFSALGPHFQYEVPPGPWDTEEEAMARGCYHGEVGGWRTLTLEDHKEVIVEIIAAFNDLTMLGLTVDDIRDDLDLPNPELGPQLYPLIGTRAPGEFGAPVPGPVADAQRIAAFKGQVAYTDQQMGRLMEHVDWENTYMIMVGDNGSQGGGPVFNVIVPPNDPNKSKATVYRNGREVPLVFAGPGEMKGVWDKQMVNVTDIYATVLDIIGKKQPKKTKRSSFSFYEVLACGGHSKRKVNVTEQWPATATVGGLNRIGAGGAGPFGSGARAVGNANYSLLAFNRLRVARPGVTWFVCRNGDPEPTDDCLNEETGIYEHVVDLEFYDLKADPLEDDALTMQEMSKKQKRAFKKLCKQLNGVSKKATYYQNGEVCKKDGSQLRDTEPDA